MRLNVALLAIAVGVSARAHRKRDCTATPEPTSTVDPPATASPTVAPPLATPDAPTVDSPSLDYSTAEAGNPVIDGWYADPDTGYYDGKFWMFPTTSFDGPEQIFFDAFSSTDLINWEKHPNIMTKADMGSTWAQARFWAPAHVERNGTFYFYFSANDLQNNEGLGGIGVATSDKPEGPYKDATGKPLIGQYYNSAAPIDQDVFIDDDGQAYIYYGGHGHANVALLNPDMISLGTFPDGQQFKEITPPGYTEGCQMFKKDGKYYMMWSEDNWTGPNYAVAYAISDSPIGPFEKKDRILEQDPEVATGSGHNGVIHIPDTDIWYIVYHRRPLGETIGDHRVVCLDRMYFNDDGTIAPVVMKVKDNFADGNLLGWKTTGGSWGVQNSSAIVGEPSRGGKADMNTNFGSQTFDAEVTVVNPGSETNADAGLIFRATELTDGPDGFHGYYAGISSHGYVVLGKSDGGWTELGRSNMTIEVGKAYNIQVSAVGSDIKVFVDDLDTPKISVDDGAHATGTNGVRVFASGGRFGKLAVARA